MDACDKASQLLKCGKENSPNLLTGMMKNLENAIVVSSETKQNYF
jgi:hypothetical protein